MFLYLLHLCGGYNSCDKSQKQNHREKYEKQQNCNQQFHSATSLDTSDSGCHHVSSVGVQDIGILLNGSAQVVPYALIVIGSHVPPDTEDFFFGQVHNLLGNNHGLVTMPGEGKVAPIIKTSVRQFPVLVTLAQVMEHTHNVGTFLPFPVKVEPFGQFQQGIGYFKAMVKQTALIIAVILCGSRCIKEPTFIQKFTDMFTVGRIENL